VSNDMIMVNDELDRMWKGPWPTLRSCPWILLERTRKTTENLSYSSWLQDGDMIQISPRHKVSVNQYKQFSRKSYYNLFFNVVWKTNVLVTGALDKIKIRNITKQLLKLGESGMDIRRKTLN